MSDYARLRLAAAGGDPDVGARLERDALRRRDPIGYALAALTGPPTPQRWWNLCWRIARMPEPLTPEQLAELDALLAPFPEHLRVHPPEHGESAWSPLARAQGDHAQAEPWSGLERTEYNARGATPVALPERSELEAPLELSEDARGPYALGEVLGFSSWSEDRRAWTRAPDGRVHALRARRMLPMLSEDPFFLEPTRARFARMRGQMHPNLPLLLDWLEEEPQEVCVLEFGGQRRSLTPRRAIAPLDAPQVVSVVLQAARALHALERLAVPHAGCLVGDGLQVDTEGVVCLADPLLLGQLGVRYPKSLTTRLYVLSPEFARGAQREAASAVFALGGAAWHLLTGELPWERRNEFALLSDVVRGAPLRLPEGVGPAPLRQIVHRMLEPEPERRFGSLSELADVLERYFYTRCPGVGRARPEGVLTGLSGPA